MLQRFLICVSVVFCCLACGDNKSSIDSATSNDGSAQTDAQVTMPDVIVSDTETATTQVLLQTTLGNITLELDAVNAPITVANFISYVNKGHYDGSVFHRVIEGFMIQGGGYNESLQQLPTDPPIKNEAGNGLQNLRGTIAMARTSVVDSATAQFFINLVDNTGLDHKNETAQGYGYAVFGKVILGMDVVDAIAKVPTGTKGIFAEDCPLENVVIQQTSIL